MYRCLKKSLTPTKLSDQLCQLASSIKKLYENTLLTPSLLPTSPLDV